MHLGVVMLSFVLYEILVDECIGRIKKAIVCPGSWLRFTASALQRDLRTQVSLCIWICCPSVEFGVVYADSATLCVVDR